MLAQYTALLQLHKHFDFVVGGSISLILSGLINRPPHDVDIMCDDNTFDKIVSFCEIMKYGGEFHKQKYSRDYRHYKFWFMGVSFCMFGSKFDKYEIMYLENQALKVAHYSYALEAKMDYIGQNKFGYCNYIDKHIEDIVAIITKKGRTL
jgi:hypothetical protein